MDDKRERYGEMKKEALFKEIFDKHYEALCLYAVKFTRDMSDAEDMVQDAFVKWWEVIEKNPAASTRAYLYQMVRNAGIDRVRQKRHDTVDIHTLVDSLEFLFQPEAENDSRIEALLEAIDTLPEKARQVFMAICVNERKYKEVAHDMNVSVNTIKTQFSRSLKLLRDRLNEKTRDT
ncbi:MAG: sigma-70 family RNA polymerase sigma factor [Odoribacteraceae bacterium]|jgi:RNA polymerase sigma-70 factor (ECF subfamily)|nr:sigma-70 family RNA polymerase sigma factor [Odoribacteraceae bacterium]